MRTMQRGMVGAFILVLLAAGSLQLGAAPVARAQQTCPTGQTYCPSGEFSGQCRANTGTCVGGSYTTCSGCVCPTGFERFSGNTCCASGTLLCGSTCQVPKRCPDANRATSNECAASNAASCGSCASGYELNNGTGLCEQTINVVVAPQAGQLGNSDRPAVNLVQRGEGLLLNLQSQTGDSISTRKPVLSVDRTGLQIGFHPEPAKNGIDLSAAGGQNLIFGIARAVGMDAALDALLLLQTIEQDGSIVDRIRVTRDGNFTASGDVRGQRLCIGGSCRDSWSAVTSSSVILQNATPGTAQSGHLNVSGTGNVGSLVVAGGITAGGSVGIIGTNGKIPAISPTYFTSLTGTLLTALNASNLAVGIVPAARLPSTVILEGESGASLTSLNASNLASGTVPSARLPAELLQNPVDGGASNMGPWMTIQGGADILENIALRLYDTGTANGNTSTLEFAHNTGRGPATLAFIKSINVGANAASGAILKLITASNNTGAFNTDQLVLDRDGNVGIGVADPTVKLHVGGALTASGNITTSGSATIGNDLTVNDDVTVIGDVEVTGNVHARNSFECVNVGSELRCNLREFWRTADRTTGFVESWRDSRTCTSVCAGAGLRPCSDIQFNYECPNGTLQQTWRDDDPNEFGVGGRNCSSSEAYRSVYTGGGACAGQAGTVYKRYRCRC